MMTRLTGIKGVLFVVRPDTIKKWAWFWIECMGGRLIATHDDMAPSNSSFSWMLWLVEFGTFRVGLLAGIDRERKHPLTDFSELHGDHVVREVIFGTQNAETFWKTANRWAGISSPQRKFIFAQDAGSNLWISPWLKRIDHVTLAVTLDTIEQERAFWVEEMGGELVIKMDDVQPNNLDDSMMLWGITFNKNNPQKKFGVALVAGINRNQKAHVTLHTEKHGVNSVQHVAFDVGDMPKFRHHFEDDLEGNLISETLFVPDGFGGFVEQVFGWGYTGENFAESQFPEFLSREHEQSAAAQFKPKAGMGLTERARNASKAGPKPLVDFSRMPKNWEPKEVSK